MALKDYPDWVLVHKGKNREIRCFNGNYYLYAYHSFRENGKVKKVTDELIGKITEDGIIPSSDKNIYFVKEYITFVIAFNVFDNEISLLKSSFPKLFSSYLPEILFDVLFDNNINAWNNSYLSVIYTLDIKEHTDNVNNKINKYKSMMKYKLDKFLNNHSLIDFIYSVNDLYMVGVKRNSGIKYKLVSYSDNTKNILNECNLEVNIDAKN